MIKKNGQIMVNDNMDNKILILDRSHLLLISIL